MQAAGMGDGVKGSAAEMILRELHAGRAGGFMRAVSGEGV